MQSNNTGTTFDRNLARIAAGAYDDAQDVRKAMMNRVRDVVRKKNEGIPFDAVEDEKDADDFDSKYDDDNLPELIVEMQQEGRLTDREFEYLQRMLETYRSALSIENQYEDVMAIAKAEPIFSEWLTNVYGVSAVLTAKLIHRFGYCEEFDRVSQIWSYAGLAPGQKRTQGEKLGYDPQAKTLLWNVAQSMIYQGENSRYKTEFYDPYKAKQVERMENSRCANCGEPTPEHDPDGDVRRCEDGTAVTLGDFEIVGYDGDGTPPWQQGHADARARRYLMKKFIKHYWYIGRDLQGLDVPDEWVVTHGGHEKRTDTFENPAHARRVLAD